MNSCLFRRVSRREFLFCKENENRSNEEELEKKGQSHIEWFVVSF